ncbi:histidinol-phosphate aminotransferase [Nadsonia fulvescens var. elongata DSM 6958]|uniref:histidinol-phosphate transaminase n=1 Tax=Nadsonia fulvescens var. elongata DSM 6958 TaxID=857566 RepID=A0A1E3PH74_9ASCO|nr:histidinol-phosphate aminotransferase [Nadsonia fulvescens var. elongata DSM 6958]
MGAFNLQTLARPNILALEPYRCARDDYTDGVLLDANENPYGPALHNLHSQEKSSELNRYPDPHQQPVKQLLCNFRNQERIGEALEVPELTPANLFFGVGSDEAIDAIIRCFCTPGKDKLLTCPPTYGMYGVSAQINDVEVVKVNLEVSSDKGAFQLRPDAVNEALSNDPLIKVAYICSPGNPTAALIDKSDIEKVLNHPTWNGIVVVDEAYIDFSPAGSSMAPYVNKYPNLVVMQTLSKSFGMAGVRLGVSFGSPEVTSLFNNMKAPYNISTPASQFAERALSPEGIAIMKEYATLLIEERVRLLKELPRIPGVGKFIGGEDANFILFEVLDKPDGVPSSKIAYEVYSALAELKGVVVRFRGKEFGCEGGIRVSIGTKVENDTFIAKFREAIQEAQRT